LAVPFTFNKKPGAAKQINPANVMLI